MTIPKTLDYCKQRLLEWPPPPRGGRFYITTAIDYPNSLPHIGTAFEKIGADVQARFRRFLGQEVYFLMGNDENTLKVSDRATELGEQPQQYADRMAAEFKKVWRTLHISNDDFIQTSKMRHRVGVQKFIQTVYDAGYIYKKAYQAPYCNGCEEFKTQKSLVNGRCPNHQNQEIETREEENYFFQQSAFKDFVWNVLEKQFYGDTAHTNVEPESRYNEVREYIKSELEDVSISRPNKGWGIPVPWDHSQVIYVWFDALLNYLTGAGFGTDSEKFDKWWPADFHIIGKDITRFHCALWPAMIAAYNEGTDKKVLFPSNVFAHGFIYQKKGDEQVKVSKSGEFVDPVAVAEKYGPEAYRYYFLSKCSFGSDGEYSADHFHEVYNGELANNLGNLLSRVVNLSLKYNLTLDGPVGERKVWFAEEDIVDWANFTTKYDYRSALGLIWKTLNQANEYLERNKPWSLLKAGKDKEKAVAVLRDVAVCLRTASLLLLPYLPETAWKVYNTFQWPDKWVDVKWDTLNHVAKNNYVGLDNGETIGLNTDMLDKDEQNNLKCPQLFPRVEA